MTEGHHYRNKIHKKMDEYVKFIYEISKNFPKDELYGARSQLRRSTLSIILNYIEGFARRKKKPLINFLEISYGSAQESRYIVYLAHSLGWISEDEYTKADKMVDEIAAILWTEISKLEGSI